MIRLKTTPKVGGRTTPTKDVFVCGRICHIRADCRAKTRVNGGPPKSATRRKGVGHFLRKKSKTHRKLCHWALLMGSFLKCCQTTARPKRTKLLLMHLQKNESTGTLPALPLVSWFKETKISRHADTRCAGSFETIAMATTAETAKSLLSSILVI